MNKILYYFLTLMMGGVALFGAKADAISEIESREDVVILGSGVGALTSAIYLQRAGINTLIIEGQTPGGAIAQSPTVHNWPGELEIDGLSLVNKIRRQAVANGARIVSQEVTAVEFSNLYFTITSQEVSDPSKTHTIQARACIIAMGSMPKLLGIPGESGEKGYWTKGVYSCAVCDGALYRNKTVAVIGGGDAAITEANYLSNIAKKVYIVLRSGEFRTVEILRMNELIKKSNVEVLYNTKIDEIKGDGQRVTHLNLSTSKQLPVDAVFVAIGANPNTAIFKNQLALDDAGYIKLMKGQETSIPGVFAIGDVVDPYYKQAISAAGDGAKAALELEPYLSALPKDSSTPSFSQPKIALVNQSADGTIQDISSKNAFYDAIGEGETPVVFDFYSPFCGPCRQLLPRLEESAKTYKGKIRFLKVNVSEFSELADAYNIFSVPTILVFNNQGKVVARGTGLDEVEKIMKKIDSVAFKK